MKVAACLGQWNGMMRAKEIVKGWIYTELLCVKQTFLARHSLEYWAGSHMKLGAMQLKSELRMQQCTCNKPLYGIQVAGTNLRSADPEHAYLERRS
jgi:hypothetical protein